MGGGLEGLGGATTNVPNRVQYCLISGRSFCSKTHTHIQHTHTLTHIYHTHTLKHTHTHIHTTHTLTHITHSHTPHTHTHIQLAVFFILSAHISNDVLDTNPPPCTPHPLPFQFQHTPQNIVLCHLHSRHK